MASKAPFKKRQRVTQTAKTARNGTVIAVKGTGPNARVTVGFDGWSTVTVSARQLKHR